MNRARLRLMALLVVGVLLLGSAVASADTSVPGTADSVRTIVSTGVGQVTVGAGTIGTVLNVGIHQQVNGDPAAAIAAVQTAVDEISAAVLKSGVPAAAIQTMNFNIYPIYGPPPEPQKVPPVDGQPTIQGYNVDENIQIDTTSPEQLAKAMEAAIKAGATSVNTYMKGGPEGTLPDAAQLATAVKAATEQAKALAEATAAASGLKLGAIRNINVQPPFAWYGGPGPGTTGWRVNVSITYDLVE